MFYSLASQTYSRLTAHGEVPRWMPDGRALLALDAGRVVAVDLATRRVREVLAPPQGSAFLTHCVSPDSRSLFVSRRTEEGDIGMLTLQ